jgi:hypothetical protein
MMLRTLTPSAVDAYTECTKIYDFSYNKAIYPTAYPSALTTGTAVHTGVESFKKGEGLEAGLAAAVSSFERKLERVFEYLPPEWVAEVKEKAARDLAKTRAMLRAYWERFHVGGPGDPPLDRELDFIAIELSFHLPMLNPRTGRASRTFMKAGRADGVAALRAKLEVGLFVWELKTTSDTVEEMVDSLKQSIQPATYQELAGRLLKRPITGAIVDIVKKPTIRGRKGEGLGDFEDRCLAAYRDEPNRFFRRVELPHDEGRVRDAMEVFWQTARAIRESDRHGYIAPRGRKCKKPFGWCEYKALCWYGNREGYRLSDQAHEELELEV